MKNSLLPFIAALLFLNSCQKEKDEIEATQISIEAIEDNIEFENAFSGIENVIVDVTGKPLDNANYQFKNCANISVSPSWSSGIFPKTITVDFGDTNCLGTDGNYRRGKIIVSISGLYKDSGTVINTSLENYYQNDNKIEGAKTKTNLGRNISGNLAFIVTLENGVLTHVNNYRISWRSTRTSEWINGENTPLNILDDEYEIDGAANGVTRSGKLFTMDIIENLNIKLDCRWIRSGIISIKPEEFSSRTVDYGNGDCDRIVTYTANGNSFQFSMR